MTQKRPATAKEKQQLKMAKGEWRMRMKALYPDFEKRKWANDNYRINHPQLI